jgi:hypothetical protein
MPAERFADHIMARKGVIDERWLQKESTAAG